MEELHDAQYLKQMNLKVTVVGNLKNDPCHRFSDESIYLDYSNLVIYTLAGATATAGSKQLKGVFMRQRTYGYDPVQMSRNMTVAELEAMLPTIIEEHTLSDDQRTGVNILDKKGMWKVDQVTWAIYHLTK